MKGNLFTYKDYLTETLNKALAYRTKYKDRLTEKEICDVLDDMISEDLLKHRRYDGRDCLYLPNNAYLEDNIIELLKKHVSEFNNPISHPKVIDNFVERYESGSQFKLADKQKEAIHTSLLNGVSILTGGPGTGKTQTINTIIKCIRDMKPDAVIHLCAPTGKASKRMTELTGEEAQTIHRLIGLNMFEDENEINDVEGDFVIVDESSMVDAFIFYKLLSAIDEHTRILLVGDHNQLPSVGAGLILRDLIESKKIPTTVLDKIFRQAKNSQIIMNSYKIINNQHDLEFDVNKKDFYFIERKTSLDIQSTVIKSLSRLIETGYSLDEVQILLPMRITDIGVNEINNIIQNKAKSLRKLSDERQLVFSECICG